MVRATSVSEPGVAWTTAPRVVRGAAVAGVANAVPQRVVTNEEVAARLGVDDHWIRKRTGVGERRLGDEHTTVAGLAAEAGRGALEAAGCDPADVDLVIVATMTPDLLTPSVAADVAALIEGMGSPNTFDLNAACNGWIDGIAMAAGQVETGRSELGLVIGADMLSRITNRDDRGTACLFGDGAGAALVGPCEGDTRIGPGSFGIDTTGRRLVYGLPEEGYLRMEGGRTFGMAIDRLSEATHAALDAVGLGIDDVDVFAYHQANGRILSAVGQRLGLPAERVLSTVGRFGNTSAASIPMALAEADREGRLQPGMNVLLGAFASGMTWAAMVVRWGAA